MGLISGLRGPPGANLSQLSLTNDNLDSSSMPLGTPVYSSGSGTIRSGKADASSTAHVIGVTIEVIAFGAAGLVQSSGFVALTTGQWDAICGTTGGLSDMPYYLSAATKGKLTATPPSTAGQVVQQVIVGVSPTVAKVDIEIPVVLGSGNNIVSLVNDSGAPMIIGSPVYSDAPGGMNNGLADNSGKSTIVGLVAAASVASATAGNVVIAGLLVATTVQWDAVCGTTGGLAFNTPYYLDKTTPGRLTATAPTSPGDIGKEVVQVIVAFSSTTAKIAIEPPFLL